MDDTASGDARARAFLQPVAAPSILGLYAFAGSTLIVAAELAGWYGNSETALYLFLFAAAFGGVAQFAAGMWAYKARDAIATAMHGMWGSFWIGFGVLHLLFATGSLTMPQGPFPALGFWFIALAWITTMGAIAATAENAALTAVLGTLALGTTFAAIAELLGSDAWTMVAGWTFVVSAVCAWYTASALMFEGVAGKPVLPVGQTKQAKEAPQVAVGTGEPSVKHGQEKDAAPPVPWATREPGSRPRKWSEERIEVAISAHDDGAVPITRPDSFRGRAAERGRVDFRTRTTGALGGPRRFRVWRRGAGRFQL